MSAYKDRIDNVIRYMEENLSQKITLDKLAEASFFSKYHFSRIFSAMVGEAPYAYLTHLRLNKSVDMLTTTDQTMLEISLQCGFDSISNFNTLFKKQFNHTPTEVRHHPNLISKIPLMDSNMPEESLDLSHYPESKQQTSFMRRMWDMNISITELADHEAAYVRHVGSYLDTYMAWGKLMEWAGKNQLCAPEQQFIGISLDDPSSTEEDACRYDACVTVPKGFSHDGDPDVQFKTLPGGLYALYHYYDSLEKFSIAYQSIYGLWLPNSEYEPDERYSLEFCMNNPGEDPEGKAKIDLYIPIRKRT